MHQALVRSLFYINQAKVLIQMWLLIKYSCKHGIQEVGLF